MPYKDPAYSRAYNAAHREEHRAYSRAYYAAHREEHRANHAAYNAAHREKYAAYARAYFAAHPSIRLLGEKTRIDTLPIELQPVALAIREARQIIRERTNPK